MYYPIVSDSQVVPLFPFLGGFRFPYKPLEAKKGTLFRPRLLGSLLVYTRNPKPPPPQKKKKGKIIIPILLCKQECLIFVGVLKQLAASKLVKGLAGVESSEVVDVALQVKRAFI